MREDEAGEFGLRFGVGGRVQPAAESQAVAGLEGDVFTGGRHCVVFSCKISILVLDMLEAEMVSAVPLGKAVLYVNQPSGLGNFDASRWIGTAVVEYTRRGRAEARPGQATCRLASISIVIRLVSTPLRSPSIAESQCCFRLPVLAPALVDTL